jgi:3-carboxy-cis,cis-muconate cycloisomerase
LGARRAAIADALARELGLPGADAPWHTSRDRLATLVSSCAIASGVLGKIARDISLLMQFEVDEAREAGSGSSTMPHKRNPSGCTRVLAAASRLPGLASTMIAGLVQEHERSVGAWQAEWPVIAEALQATGAGLEALRDVVAELSVDPGRMRANLDATRGAIFTERVMMLAGPTLGRHRAHQLLKDALALSSSKGASLADIVRSVPELAQILTEDDLRTLDDPHAYLGAAEALRQRLLSPAGEP